MSRTVAAPLTRAPPSSSSSSASPSSSAFEVKPDHERVPFHLDPTAHPSVRGETRPREGPLSPRTTVEVMRRYRKPPEYLDPTASPAHPGAFEVSAGTGSRPNTSTQESGTRRTRPGAPGDPSVRLDRGHESPPHRHRHREHPPEPHRPPGRGLGDGPGPGGRRARPGRPARARACRSSTSPRCRRRATTPTSTPAGGPPSSSRSTPSSSSCPSTTAGYNAALKNAIDYLYAEWDGLPVACVGYGWSGAQYARSALRQTLERIKMVVVEGAELHFEQTLDLDGTVHADDAATDRRPPDVRRPHRGRRRPPLSPSTRSAPAR